ncbi:unnamed protein product [Pedinophyceae sp. YPF-701]|nr:unnamed protein product [Pedinophyceae sp. YPF-701]
MELERGTRRVDRHVSDVDQRVAWGPLGVQERPRTSPPGSTDAFLQPRKKGQAKRDVVSGGDKFNRQLGRAAGVDKRAGGIGPVPQGPPIVRRHPAAAADVTRSNSWFRRKDPNTAPDNRRGQGNYDNELAEHAVRFREKWCTQCRDLHEPAKVGDPTWRPYTVRERMTNLGILVSSFRGEYESGRLPVELKEASGMIQPHGGKAASLPWEEVGTRASVQAEQARPAEVRWKEGLKPATMPEERFRSLLPLLVDGCREQHEPYRHLALRATEELAEAGAHRGLLAGVMPQIVHRLRLAVNTFEVSHVCMVMHLMKMFLKLAEVEPAVAAELLSAVRQTCPVLLLFRNSAKKVKVPPVGCLPLAGTFSGRPAPPPLPGDPPRTCGVCGKPVDRVPMIKVRGRFDELGQPLMVKKTMDRVAEGRRGVRTWAMAELVQSTFEEAIEVMGAPALKVIKSYIPTFEYIL